jgi:hypothetical protein
VKKTSQDLYRLHKPVVEARESPRPSLIMVELYDNHAELREKRGLPLSIEGSNNSDDEALPNQSYKMYSENLTASLGQQWVLRRVIHICTITVDNT